jgi:hypothetical protein
MPTCPFPSPTTTIAVKPIRLPPVVAFETLLIWTTVSSFNCKSVGLIILSLIKNTFY